MLSSSNPTILPIMVNVSSKKQPLCVFDDIVLPVLSPICYLRIGWNLSVLNQILRAAQAAVRPPCVYSALILSLAPDSSFRYHFFIVSRLFICYVHRILLVQTKMCRDTVHFRIVKLPQRFLYRLQLFLTVKCNWRAAQLKFSRFLTIFLACFLQSISTATRLLGLPFEVLKILFLKALATAFILFQVLFLKLLPFLEMLLKLFFDKIDILLTLCSSQPLLRQFLRLLHLEIGHAYLILEFIQFVLIDKTILSRLLSPVLFLYQLHKGMLLLLVVPLSRSLSILVLSHQSIIVLLILLLGFYFSILIKYLLILLLLDHRAHISPLDALLLSFELLPPPSLPDLLIELSMICTLFSFFPLRVVLKASDS